MMKLNDLKKRQMRIEQSKMGEQTIFTFKNETQRDLWEHELTGQISDGMWENTLNTGWTYWCNVKSEIGTETKLNGQHPYMNIKFNFGFTRLIKYVLEDMLEIGQKYNPNYTEKDLRKDLREISAAMKKFGEK